MTCAACVNSVEGILRDVPGVKRAVVALATSLGEVEFDPCTASKEDIVAAIEDAGFDASFLHSSQQDRALLAVSGVYGDMDLQLLAAILANLRGIRHFTFDRISSHLDVLFDPLLLHSRSLVDGIQAASNARFKLRPLNPYSRMTSKDAQEASNMFRLFISSFFLSVGILARLVRSTFRFSILTCLAGWLLNVDFRFRCF